MKLEFNVFDINNFVTTEDWGDDCVFILEDGKFIDGRIDSYLGIIGWFYYDIICDEIYEVDDISLPTPKFYMFKD